jgi:hypothetical protein
MTVNHAWLTALAESFQDKICNCKDKYKMDIAVKHSWVENLAEAKNFKNMTGMLIADVLELKLTATDLGQALDHVKSHRRSLIIAHYFQEFDGFDDEFGKELRNFISIIVSCRSPTYPAMNIDHFFQLSNAEPIHVHVITAHARHHHQCQGEVRYATNLSIAGSVVL